MNWDNVDQVVKELIELTDYCRANVRDYPDARNFKLNSIKVEPDFMNKDTLKVSAYDAAGKPFIYAMYIDHDGRVETDGY